MWIYWNSIIHITEIKEPSTSPIGSKRTSHIGIKTEFEVNFRFEYEFYISYLRSFKWYFGHWSTSPMARKTQTFFSNKITPICTKRYFFSIWFQFNSIPEIPFLSYSMRYKLHDFERELMSHACCNSFVDSKNKSFAYNQSNYDIVSGKHAAYGALAKIDMATMKSQRPTKVKRKRFFSVLLSIPDTNFYRYSLKPIYQVHVTQCNNKNDLLHLFSLLYHLM